MNTQVSVSRQTGKELESRIDLGVGEKQEKEAGKRSGEESRERER